MSKDEDSAALEDLEEDLNDPQTMIAVELKLASCLKLMSEEIVSIAGQLEGSELRLHLYAWLEKQVCQVNIFIIFNGKWRNAVLILIFRCQL